MGEVVNLRRFRKGKMRAEAAAQAAENRAKHGRSKTERDAASKSRTLGERKLEGHRRAPKDDEPSP
jgi:hypothetical protein